MILKFRSKTNPDHIVWAIQFDGTVDSGREIFMSSPHFRKWDFAQMLNAPLFDLFLYKENDKIPFKLRQGDWFVASDVNYSFYNDYAFHNQYECIDNRVKFDRSYLYEIEKHLDLIWSKWNKYFNMKNDPDKKTQFVEETINIIHKQLMRFYLYHESTRAIGVLLFKKNNEVVEVMQFNGLNADYFERWSFGIVSKQPFSENVFALGIHNSKGRSFVHKNDYVVKRENGEFYCVSKDVFEKEYQPYEGDDEVAKESEDHIFTCNNCTVSIGISANQHRCDKDVESPSKQTYPLYHKQLEIGNEFIGICTKTKMKVHFAVIGYDREDAILTLAILSKEFPINWKVCVNGLPEICYPAMKVHLWDKGLEIAEYLS